MHEAMGLIPSTSKNKKNFKNVPHGKDKHRLRVKGWTQIFQANVA
jgi:hypothetical protein